MKNFALIGLAGFVAKKHVKCIQDVNGRLIAALDMHDNVGFIDNSFPDCKFFKEENIFFSFLKKHKVDYVVICSPSNLHFRHIKKSIISRCNVIVEKPPVLQLEDYEKIIYLENKYKKKCYCIFQLRLDKKLIKLKNQIIASKKFDNKVSIKYYTYRGDWYFKSWKNNKKLSGGILVNIAIHFFDVLIWVFGNDLSFKILKKNSSKVEGIINLEKADVSWTVSLENIKKLNKNIKTKYLRNMKVNNRVINFDKFDNLHLENYKEILKGNFHISNFIKIIKFLSKLK